MGKDRKGSLKNIKDVLYGKVENKRQDGFVDCCEEFKFIRKSNTISFNNKMNRMGITHLVLDDEHYDMSDVFLYDIVNPIKYGAGSKFGITGYTRSGKSELAELITLLSKEANLKYLNREVDLYLTWTQPHFYKELNKLKKGDVMWRDEDPRGTRKGSRTQKWEIENVLHAIAKMENTFIFVDPKKVKVDCDLYLESAGMNRKTKINRFMLLDDEKYYFGHIYVKLHEDHEFREWYEEEKDKFIKKAIKLRGKFLAEEGEEDDESVIEMTEGVKDDFFELDTFEYLEDNLKNGNEITIKEYTDLIGVSYKVATRMLKEFVSERKLKSKKVGKSHKLVFYI